MPLDEMNKEEFLKSLKEGVREDFKLKHVYIDDSEDPGMIGFSQNSIFTLSKGKDSYINYLIDFSREKGVEVEREEDVLYLDIGEKKYRASVNSEGSYSGEVKIELSEI